MGRKYQLSAYETKLLYILWKAGRPLLVSEIADRGLNISTVRAAIRSMYEKNLLEVAGRAKSGTVFGRCYQPAINLREYEMDKMVNDFKDRLSPEITVSTLAKAYLEGLDEGSRQEELEKLQQIIDENKKRKN